jgi:hypothetical protein
LRRCRTASTPPLCRRLRAPCFASEDTCRNQGRQTHWGRCTKHRRHTLLHPCSHLEGDSRPCSPVPNCRLLVGIRRARAAHCTRPRQEERQMRTRAQRRGKREGVAWRFHDYDYHGTRDSLKSKTSCRHETTSRPERARAGVCRTSTSPSTFCAAQRRPRTKQTRHLSKRITWHDACFSNIRSTPTRKSPARAPSSVVTAIARSQTDVCWIHASNDDRSGHIRRRYRDNTHSAARRGSVRRLFRPSREPQVPKEVTISGLPCE